MKSKVDGPSSFVHESFFGIFSEIRPKFFGLHDFVAWFWCVQTVFPSSFGIKSSYVDLRRWEFAKNRRVWSTSFFKSFFCWEIETAILSDIRFSAAYGFNKNQSKLCCITYEFHEPFPSWSKLVVLVETFRRVGSSEDRFLARISRNWKVTSCSLVQESCFKLVFENEYPLK